MAKDYSLKSFTIRQMSAVDGGALCWLSLIACRKPLQKANPKVANFLSSTCGKKTGDSWKLANRFVSKVSSVPFTPKTDARPTGKQ